MQETKKVARMSGYSYGEAVIVRLEASCVMELGDYKKSIPLCLRGREFLGLCSLSGGAAEHTILNIQAEVHRAKSEYAEARNI
jgi:hypothetical protein